MIIFIHDDHFFLNSNLTFSVLQFYTSQSQQIHLISGSDDGRIYVHNLHAPSEKPVQLEGHMSTVTSLALYQDHTLLR